MPPPGKDFLREMNKYWFDGDGESINKAKTKIFSRYSNKILGIRNYKAEKAELYATDFINRNTLLRLYMGSLLITKVILRLLGAFLNEYFDFQELAEELRQYGKQLPPYGGGKSEKEHISKFVKYMNNVKPMEVALFIAESQWNESKKEGDKPSLANIDDRLLPPEKTD